MAEGKEGPGKGKEGEIEGCECLYVTTAGRAHIIQVDIMDIIMNHKTFVILPLSRVGIW